MKQERDKEKLEVNKNWANDRFTNPMLLVSILSYLQQIVNDNQTGLKISWTMDKTMEP